MRLTFDAGTLLISGGTSEQLAALPGCRFDPRTGGHRALARHYRTIVEHLRRKGIGPAPLSRCALEASGYNGLVIGYANVAKEHAATSTRRMLAAIQGAR